MSLWDRIKNGNKPQEQQQQAGTPPDDFDYKAGYKRAVAQLKVLNHNLIVATVALGMARDMANALVDEAKHIEIECLEGEHDGHKECGYTVTHDALDAYKIAHDTWQMTLEHIKESMGKVAYDEIKERIASNKTTDTERSILEQLLKEAEKVGK